MTPVLTWPVMAIKGMLSSLASAMQVTRLVAPGPLVAMQTPGLPVVRAKPWAAKPPPCSCRGRMVRRRSLIFGQRLVQRHAGSARIGEDHLHPVVDERLDEDVGAALHLPGGAFGRGGRGHDGWSF